ncbi:ABC-type sugar transport system substrate-binding protein [Rhodoferax ferrireducens]|uniref:ABC-type sugar transport system substrate-binding protein n=1 Tax=Rhodoferax ferrireducens TaxID=192843 RepID=A0ABU2CAP4_9BURK|nr:ABC transporter substrate-binding protein [Rhodoferax ferrireducens]MDR7378376.1 ABC-type sugar transport system substrate-binding protein [Rhodoferax ferrireducens]
MQRYTLIRYVLLCWALLAVGSAHAVTVAFINPGKSNEAYWVAATQAMQVAARSLDWQLEVQYAERDHLRVLDLARSMVARPPAQRPDYVILSNDNATGAELLRLFDGSGIKCFMAFSRLSAADEAQLGGPRQRHKDWIGSLEPLAEEAGYLTAKALIQQGRSARAQAADGKLHLLAIAGDRSTPSSVRRNEGLQRAVAEAQDVVLEQTIYAGWTRDKAAEQADWLYERYPTARLVWAGNDLMAFGAMQALEKRGGTPGKNMWFSGINASADGMQAIQSGRLAALAGGHFIAGAWALVMLYDYHHGRDFADEGLQLEASMFVLFDPAMARKFEARFGQRYDSIDFRRYSKVLNPKLARYSFGFAQLLR